MVQSSSKSYNKHYHWRSYVGNWIEPLVWMFWKHDMAFYWLSFYWFHPEERRTSCTRPNRFSFVSQQYFPPIHWMMMKCDVHNLLIKIWLLCDDGNRVRQIEKWLIQTVNSSTFMSMKCSTTREFLKHPKLVFMVERHPSKNFYTHKIHTRVLWFSFH